MERLTFTKHEELLTEICTICYDYPREAKTCLQCNAMMCNSCLMTLVETYKVNNCPQCKKEFTTELLLDSFQLRYVCSQLKTSTEKIETLKGQLKVVETKMVR